jgi:hypothetical protein
MAQVHVGFTVQGIDHGALSDEDKDAIKNNIASCLVEELLSVETRDVKVMLDAGSVNVDAIIGGFSSECEDIANETRGASSKLQQLFLSAIKGIDGLPTTGEMSVSAPTATVQQVTTTPSQVPTSLNSLFKQAPREHPVPPSSLSPISTPTEAPLLQPPHSSWTTSPRLFWSFNLPIRFIQ